MLSMGHCAERAAKAFILRPRRKPSERMIFEKKKASLYYLYMALSPRDDMAVFVKWRHGIRAMNDF